LILGSYFEDLPKLHGGLPDTFIQYCVVSSLSIKSTNVLHTVFSVQLLLFGEIMTAQKVMYEKFRDEFVINFVSNNLSTVHCPQDLAEQYYQKLQVLTLLLFSLLL
jgi:exportin-T